MLQSLLMGIVAKTRPQLDLFKHHKEQTENCKRCPLHKTRRHAVCGRGYIPCDLLILGEAPGQSEDTIRLPFCGPAGDKLEEILSLSQEMLARELRIAISNIVTCIPYDQDRKLRSPKYEEALACSGRLREFIDMARPKWILTLGRIAEKYLGLQKDLPRYIRIASGTHPTAILRMKTPQQQELAAKKLALTIQELCQ